MTVFISRNLIEVLFFQIQICDITSNGTQSKECDTSEDVRVESSTTFLVFVIAAVLIGVGGVAPFPLGFSYIDENVPKKDSAAYIGTVVACLEKDCPYTDNIEDAPGCFLCHVLPKRNSVILENKTYNLKSFEKVI